MSIKNTKLRFKDLFVGRIVYAAVPGTGVIKCKVVGRRPCYCSNMTLTCSPTHNPNLPGVRFDIKDVLNRPFTKDTLAKIPAGTRSIHMTYAPAHIPAFQLEVIGFSYSQEFTVVETTLKENRVGMRLLRTLKQAQRYAATEPYEPSEHPMLFKNGAGEIIIWSPDEPVTVTSAN